jgi:hypothetical protein
MTRAEIQAFFLAKPVWFGGLNYAVPELSWLQGKFWDFFKARLWSENLDKWLVRWECRDFARGFACAAQECNATTAGGPGDCDALAVGEFWFIPDNSPPGQGHAICACITENGLQFIEPQTGAVRPVSETEFASCYFVRF